MINFATIGTNFVVDWFLEAVEQCDNLCYVATYSRDKEKGEAFSKKHNGKMVFTDLNKLANVMKFMQYILQALIAYIMNRLNF